MTFIDQIKQQYLNQTANVFLLHGNTGDQFWDSKQDFVYLRDYLAEELFAKRDIIIFFNPGSGIKFYNDKSRQLFMQLVKGYDTLQGTDYFNQLPANYGEILKLIDRFIRIQGKDNSIALVIDYAQLLFPNEDLSDLDYGDIAAVTTVLEWSKSREVTTHDVTVCLIAEQLASINSLLTQSELIAKVEVGMPEIETRSQIVTILNKKHKVKAGFDIAKLTNGFTTSGLVKLFAGQDDKSLEPQEVSLLKRNLIESQTGGLVEIVESKRKLTDVAGLAAAKRRLAEDAKLMQQGKTDVMPMGYLICGPIGTGKSYLAECYAGEIGIPAIKLRNFRDKFVGQTEANWERILGVIKNLAPVLVIIDEADAALGNREQDGDSGTQQRVFAKLAETMGDTKNRGKVIWMLLTSRPELLPVDLKRQGRAEVHIPLLYPSDNQEKLEMFKALAGKLKFDKPDLINQVVDFKLDEVNSGADIESIIVKAQRELALAGNLSTDRWQKIVESFRSSISAEVIKYQTMMALAEVTDQELISNK